jgi:hypothetical protein
MINNDSGLFCKRFPAKPVWDKDPERACAARADRAKNRGVELEFIQPGRPREEVFRLAAGTCDDGSMTRWD